MTYQSFLSDILFIVVLYKRKISECESIQSIITGLREYSIDIFIYDNSPEYNTISYQATSNIKIHYRADAMNSGISKAYNEGAKFAKKGGKRWLIFSDQDTVFKDNALYMYYLSIMEFPNNVLFVPILKNDNLIISPCKYYLKNGFLFKEEFYGLTSIRHKSVLNSGLCISLKAFEEIGGYNERISLYFSDFNFIDRFRKKYKTFVVVKTIANHDFSLLSLDNETSMTFFENYCIGARSLVNNVLEYIIILMVALYRMILLSMKFKRLVFVKIFIYYFIFNRNNNGNRL